jgi:hypothetical protein
MIKEHLLLFVAAIMCVAIVLYKSARHLHRRAVGLYAAVSFVLMAAYSAMAQTDPTVITTSATTAFVGVATLCVSIGTFFVGYRIIKKIK